MDHLNDYITAQRHANGNYWLGVIMGVTFTALAAMALSKLTAEPSQPYIAQDVIDAYRQGGDDSLKTNPPSAALEMTCLELWANKQPR